MRPHIKQNKTKINKCETKEASGDLSHMPLILALRRQRQEDFSEFKVSLIYILSFGQLDYIVRLSQNAKTNKKKEHHMDDIYTKEQLMFIFQE